MGAFGIGTNVKEIDSGELRGKTYKAACELWVTSVGRILPKYLEFEGDDGTIQPVKNIRLKYTEDKNYSGIPTKECNCVGIIGGIQQDFKIVYNKETCICVMVI